MQYLLYHPVRLIRELEDNCLNFVFIKKKYLQEQRGRRQELSKVYSEENEGLWSEVKRFQELVANNGNEQDMDANIWKQKYEELEEQYTTLKDECEKVKAKLKKKENVVRQDKHEIRSMRHQLGITKIKDKNMFDDINNSITAEAKEGVNEMKFKLESNADTAKSPVKQLENLFESNLWFLDMEYLTFEKSGLGEIIIAYWDAKAENSEYVFML